MAEIRQLRGMSQEELAEKADLHRTTAGKIERAQTGASLQTIEKLAEVLEVHPMEFFRTFEAGDTKGLGE